MYTETLDSLRKVSTLKGGELGSNGEDRRRKERGPGGSLDRSDGRQRVRGGGVGGGVEVVCLSSSSFGGG